MTPAIIITVLIIALTVWACCRMSAQSTPYPCRYCEEEHCEECEYWRKMTWNKKENNHD